MLALTDDVAADGPLDILINNACQTVGRSPGAYAQLLEMESAPLPDLAVLPRGRGIPTPTWPRLRSTC